jgi:hypothetical protein
MKRMPLVLAVLVASPLVTLAQAPVLTQDGRTVSFKVGDKVEITYTQAFMVSVK